MTFIGCIKVPFPFKGELGLLQQKSSGAVHHMLPDLEILFPFQISNGPAVVVKAWIMFLSLPLLGSLEWGTEQQL